MSGGVFIDGKTPVFWCSSFSMWLLGGLSPWLFEDHSVIKLHGSCFRSAVTPLQWLRTSYILDNNPPEVWIHLSPSLSQPPRKKSPYHPFLPGKKAAPRERENKHLHLLSSSGSGRVTPDPQEGSHCQKPSSGFVWDPTPHPGGKG